MSHAEAPSFIHIVTLAASQTSQSMLNAGSRSGAIVERLATGRPVSSSIQVSGVGRNETAPADVMLAAANAVDRDMPRKNPALTK